MRWITFLFLAACGGEGDGGGTTAQSCDACTGGDVCVSHLGGDDEHDSCAATPSECGGAASCDDTCRGALYDLCDAGYYGVGCSDGFEPVIVSCNPDE
jgi:hypothetical protein